MLIYWVETYLLQEKDAFFVSSKEIGLAVNAVTPKYIFTFDE